MTALRLAAVLLTALYLVPTGAHLFELPNKIGLSPDAYFIVQGVYRGWALFGVVLFGALAADLALAIARRRDAVAFWLALGSALLIAGTLIIFFVWIYRANQATANWTSVPPSWARLRAQWEYSHAGNAVLTFVALVLVTCAALRED